MSKVWDDKVKRLFGLKPQDYVQWLLPEATFVDTVSLELKTVTRTINADILCEVLINGKKALVHIEIQRRFDPDMAERVWEYNVLATLANECPVYSFVIYLLPHSKIPESPLIVGLPEYEAVHIFRFTNIKLSELMVEDIRKYNLKGILPLCLLTKDGARHEVGDTILEELAASTEKKDKELLTLAFNLASLIFTSEADDEWLERKFTMLEEIFTDTWFERRLSRKLREELRGEVSEAARKEGLKEGLKEGREEGLKEGLKEGREEGLKEGREEAMRSVVLKYIQARHPAIMELAKQRVDQIHVAAELDNLFLKLIIAKNQEETLQAFQDINYKTV